MGQKKKYFCSTSAQRRLDEKKKYMKRGAGLKKYDDESRPEQTVVGLTSKDAHDTHTYRERGGGEE